eukprot:Skav211796  [mRNA]  locus=scaffold305:309349:314303:+ [translate_table: standard]
MTCHGCPIPTGGTATGTMKLTLLFLQLSLVCSSNFLAKDDPRADANKAPALEAPQDAPPPPVEEVDLAEKEDSHAAEGKDTVGDKEEPMEEEDKNTQVEPWRRKSACASEFAPVSDMAPEGPEEEPEELEAGARDGWGWLGMEPEEEKDIQVEPEEQNPHPKTTTSSEPPIDDLPAEEAKPAKILDVKDGPEPPNSEMPKEVINDGKAKEVRKKTRSEADMTAEQYGAEMQEALKKITKEQEEEEGATTQQLEEEEEEDDAGVKEVKEKAVKKKEKEEEVKEEEKTPDPKEAPQSTKEDKEGNEKKKEENQVWRPGEQSGELSTPSCSFSFFRGMKQPAM